jgi:hypothetical protein
MNEKTCISCGKENTYFDESIKVDGMNYQICRKMLSLLKD